MWPHSTTLFFFVRVQKRRHSSSGNERDIWKMIEVIIEEELCRKLDEDCGKKLIYKMARERNGESKDVKTGSVIKNKNGEPVMERKYALQIWEDYFKETLSQREYSELELPSPVEGEVKLEEIKTKSSLNSVLEEFSRRLRNVAVDE